MKERTIGSRRLFLVQGDIVQQKADALVTAANAGLRGGGGVDGAIHRAAGPQLLEACRAIGGCPTGSAVITGSYDLEGRGVRFVIHAVGPVWHGGGEGEAEMLASAYRTALELADTHDCASVALPAISAGIYGYPLEEAATIAVQEATRFLAAGPRSVSTVTFVLYDAKAFGAFTNEALRP
jgi:O-acetyl-ADP-ribose deacetylase (regulator of RNase III)